MNCKLYKQTERHQHINSNSCLKLHHFISDISQDEELYESIYEVIGPKSGSSAADFESESDFDEILEEGHGVTSVSGHQYHHRRDSKNSVKIYQDTKLTKLAEAANKKMRKLRRNWSLKKSDFSKSWSRIRKYSSPSMTSPPRPSITISHSNTLKRKPSRRSATTSG